MKIQALYKKRAAAKAAAKASLETIDKENREMTAEEQQKLDGYKAEIESLSKQIETAENFDFDSDEVNSEEDNKTKPKTGASIGNSGSAVQAKKDFETMDQFMEAVINNPNDQRLTFVAYGDEHKSEQRFDTGVKGGFMVPPQFRSDIMSVDAAEELVRPRATVIPAGSPPDAEIFIPALEQTPDDSDNPRMFGGVEVYKTAEGGLKTQTDANLRMISLKPHEIAARITFTDKLLRNWQAASGWSTTLLRGALAAYNDTQFLRGNGINGARGVIDEDSTIDVPRGTSMQVDFDDFKALFAAFRGDYSKAVIGVSYSVFGQLLNMVGDGGGATNIIQYDRALNAMSIYGVPIKRHPRLRALGSKGDVILADFRSYLIKEGSGPIVEVGYAQGEWERNKRSIKITYNVDGKSWLKAPVTDEDGSETSYVCVLGLPSGS